MEHSHDHLHEEHDDTEEPVVVRRMTPNELLAADLNKHGIDSKAVHAGTYPFEKQEYYSQKFGLSSRLVTNRGIIKVNGKNFDFIHVLERN